MAVPAGSAPSNRRQLSVTVSTEADGLSGVIDCGGATMSSIVMSTAWTAATLTFTSALTADSTFFDVYGSTGDEITYTTTANRVITFDPAFWIGTRFLKIRSGATGAAVAQAAARTLTVHMQTIGAIK
jgi:hypothetical protein